MLSHRCNICIINAGYPRSSYLINYREFSKSGADIIKFQARNNKRLFSKEAYNKIYDSENSFGKTYGQHREKLELSFNDFRELIG